MNIEPGDSQSTIPLLVSDFASFFSALHSFPPFEWQKRLAEQVCRGEWPEYIKLPTASGKTSVIEIAVFALAFQACESNRPQGQLTAARRIFFVVDRRIIVNEAFLQASAMAKALWDALSQEGEEGPKEILHQVASWLQSLTGDPQAPPLDCRELRGGIYRDDSWVRSPLQPTVLASTVDQVGSRLLFRGYGVSDRSLPIHASLTANDSLIVLDEAHCSNPFSQTLKSIERYRSGEWAETPVESPFSFVQMTATPPMSVRRTSVFELSEEFDYRKDALLEKRHSCSKPIALVTAKGASGKNQSKKIAKRIVEEAKALSENHVCKRIAIIVNRVSIAREAFKLLQMTHAQSSSLMIGRMRPLDRDDLTKEFQRKFRSGTETYFERPQFVVATQCLEVGADFDFDGMVCQCASLDALRQRFGRLNRMGNSKIARGVIVVAEGDLQQSKGPAGGDPVDPIYGNALAKTWHWLVVNQNRTGDVGFGVRELEESLKKTGATERECLYAPAPNSPVLMPAHLDMLCQTNPKPALAPDVAAYLHGPGRGMPEVRVCWRADFDMINFKMNCESHLSLLQRDWAEAASVCPPSSSECLVVPLHVLRQWISGRLTVDQTSDVLGEECEGYDAKLISLDSNGVDRCALVWRGPTTQQSCKVSGEGSKGKEGAEGHGKSFLVHNANSHHLASNDLVIIPVELGGWGELGFVPGAPGQSDGCALELESSSDAPAAQGRGLTAAHVAIDIGDRAYYQTRAKIVFRVHSKLKDNAAELRPLFDDLLSKLSDPETDFSVNTWKGKLELLIKDSTRLGKVSPSNSRNNSWRCDSFIDNLVHLPGRLTRYPRGIVWTTGLCLDSIKGIPPIQIDSYDDESLLQVGRLSLAQHLADVHAAVCKLSKGVGLSSRLHSVLLLAAKFHDIGKADPRFQALLHRSPVSAVYMQTLLAKSGIDGSGSGVDLPMGFRHEMVSLGLLNYFSIGECCDQELLSHLIASHHGFARPLAPICLDEEQSEIYLSDFGDVAITHEDRRKWPSAHSMDSGICNRFWLLNKRFGWWGLAWLETILRLADWAASGQPQRGDVSALNYKGILPLKNLKTSQNVLVLPGIDGGNPLGYIAALGVFRTLDGLEEEKYTFSWRKVAGYWRPTIVNYGFSPFAAEALIEILISENDGLDFSQIPAYKYVPENGEHRNLFVQVAANSTLSSREDTDWLSCSGMDGLDLKSVSQLQVSRRDYQKGIVKRLLTKTNSDHLRRALFEPWDYSDPVESLSLKLDPCDDRRHAYRWHAPISDPARSQRGGMIGANRMALAAWPFFQSLPMGERIATVGFRGFKANNISLTWPIWTSPISASSIKTVLSLKALQQPEISHAELRPMGIECVYRSKRIFVGKTSSISVAIPL